MKTDYYELLEVKTDASDTELKKAYRKKALQLHPDKNPHDVEAATARFALVRAAYEVLSDPQERSWYDSHKTQILNEDDIKPSDNNEDFVIPSISVEEIYRYFNPAFYTRVDDSQAGFYYMVGSLFNRLASEEINHGRYQNSPGYDKYQDNSPQINVLDDSQLLYPRFGNSSSDYSNQVRNFYNVWSSFQTVKGFNWKDEYRLSTAPDRKTRRLMEKENKKFRDGAKKEYNETIRSFVQFIRKRDPRVKVGIEQLEKERKLKKQQEVNDNIRLNKQQRLKELAEFENFQDQDWQKLSLEELNEIEEMMNEEYNTSSDSEYDEFAPVGEESQVDEFECIVCNKFFKNEKQYDIHEKSKNHRKAVNKLRYEMRKEGVDLGIDDDDFKTASEGEEDDVEDMEDMEDDMKEGHEMKDDDDDNENNDNDAKVDNVVSDTTQNPLTNNGDSQAIEPLDYEVDDEINSDDDDFSPLPTNSPRPESKQKSKPKSKGKSKKPFSQVEEPIDEELAKLTASLANGSKLDDESDDDWGSKKPKKSKKKKNEKPVSSEGIKSSISVSNEPSNPTQEICVSCKSTFSSRNKLFQHVKETGHAAPPTQVKSSKKKKKR